MRGGREGGKGGGWEMEGADLARDTSSQEDREGESWVHLLHQLSQLLTALQL